MELDLREQKGRFELRWINIESGDWGRTEMLQGGDWRRVIAPGKGHWAAAVNRED